ncbi:hypothetical protein [Lacrimispora sp. 210928-DFI.3.58]|uniref:hypothetical protein n=1 Tax=Lacrimispora sp. 210928-DFI.3.58 TaxID=2883214 RepID=UPI001D097909|nr:hypothetical protein [Lacrimispora sp. 210928-DFI.3.58]MCB7320460.1 hypothetical protein [Lacrimispora sp. 210928-DFI.3.58]
MSGPKVSVYTLSKTQLLALQVAMEQERKEREKQEKIRRKKQMVISQINTESDKLNRMESELSEYLVISKDLIQWKNDESMLNAILAAQNDVMVLKKRISKAKKETGLNELEADYMTIKSGTDTIKKEICKIVVLKKEKERHLDLILNKSVSTGFWELSNKENPEEDQKVQEQKRAVMDQLDSILDKIQLPITLAKKIQEVKMRLNGITDIQYFSNYIAIGVKPLMEEVEKFEEFVHMWGEKYDALTMRYRILCDELGIAENQALFSYDEQGISALEKEVNRLEKQSLKLAEQAYISDTLDEIMEEMGYNILGHRNVHKKNGTVFHNELYNYGDGNAINVTYSSDGKIAMELGKLDERDRMPNADEQRKLVQTMSTFCRDFTTIEERLKEKGIFVGNRVSMMPPNEAFSQIINISEYETTNKSSGQEMQRKQKQKRKKNNQMMEE